MGRFSIIQEREPVGQPLIRPRTPEVTSSYGPSMCLYVYEYTRVSIERNLFFIFYRGEFNFPSEALNIFAET